MIVRAEWSDAVRRKRLLALPYSAVRYLGVGDAWCGGDQTYPIEYYVFRSAITQHPFLLVAEECLVTAAESD